MVALPTAARPPSSLGRIPCAGCTGPWETATRPHLVPDPLLKSGLLLLCCPFSLCLPFLPVLSADPPFRDRIKTIMSDAKAVIKNADMSDDMQMEAVEVSVFFFFFFFFLFGCFRSILSNCGDSLEC